MDVHIDLWEPPSHFFDSSDLSKFVLINNNKNTLSLIVDFAVLCTFNTLSSKMTGALSIGTYLNGTSSKKSLITQAKVIYPRYSLLQNLILRAKVTYPFIV